MSARLEPMGPDEAVELAREVERDYAHDLESHGAMPQDAARRKAAADIPALLADETTALYAVEADGERVGRLWVGERETNVGRALWIYDVFVDETFRGRGLGKETMVLAEEVARQRGLARIALNVFGGNHVARGLYASLGYNEVAVVMRKDVR